MLLSLDDSKTTNYGYAQPKNINLADYIRHFQSLIEVMEHYNSSIGEVKYFLDRVGILVNDVEPDGIESIYVDPKLNYNHNKALVGRNHSIVVSWNNIVKSD